MLGGFIVFGIVSSANAQHWGATEAQFQYGNLHQTGTGGATADTAIFTFQYAGGWKYGETFFFVDLSHFRSDKNGDNPFNPGADGSEAYAEWYTAFYLGKISGKSFKFGPVKDIGLVAGFNWAPDVDSMWYLPGVRFSLDLPGFAFATLDVTAFINQSFADASATEFKIFDEGNSWMTDFSWDYPFKIGKTGWSVVGHVEYIDGRTQVNTFGTTELSWWVLAQPQVRLDLGELLYKTENQLFVGIEYQYWKNKQGEDGTTDNAVQLLVVWRF